MFFNANFKTIAGINPGGTGFMSGTINISNLRLGAFRMAAVTASDIRFFLIDSLNNVVQTTVTNSSGYFQFSNLELGKCKIWVDKPYVNNSLAQIITLSSLNTSQSNMQFILHDTSLEKTLGVTAVSASIGLNNSISIYPNPAREILHILFTGIQPTNLSYNLIDMTGKVIVNSSKGNDMDISNIGKGIYFVKIQTEDAVAYKKIVID